MSLFISFEGGEGSGKSTQARLLAEWLAASRRPTVLVREPGSTILGHTLRRLVKGMSMTPMAELLLFGAARAELAATVIRPHIEKGHVVVSDRYADSTIAYQQYGRQIDAQQVALAIQLATQGLKPDVTFLLDLPPEKRRDRAGKSQIALPLGEAPTGRLDDASQTRFERESLQFHRRVRAGYKALAQAEPQRWVVLDATLSIDDLHHQVCKHLESRLPPPGPRAVDLLDLTEMDGK